MVYGWRARLFGISLFAVAACSSPSSFTPSGPHELGPVAPTGAKIAERTPLPRKASAFGAAVVGDALYVQGGHAGLSHDESVDTFLSQTLRLDLASGSAKWEEIEGPKVPIQQSVLFAWEGKLYRLGGLTAKNRAGDPPDLYALADFAAYDPATKAWTSLPPMPAPRASHDAQVIDGTLYVTGGWRLDGPADKFAYDKTWLSFDMKSPGAAWVVHEQPFVIRDHCGGVVDGKLYVLGGMHSGTFPAESWIYDPKSGGWSNGPQIPAKSIVRGFGCGAATVDEALYFSALEGIVYRLDAARTGWEEIATLNVKRAFHRLVARSPAELIAVGGALDQDGTPTDSVESVFIK